MAASSRTPVSSPTPDPSERSPRWPLLVSAVGLLLLLGVGLVALWLRPAPTTTTRTDGPREGPRPKTTWGSLANSSTDAGFQEDGGSEPGRLIVRVIEGEKPVVGARIQVIVRDGAHRATAPTCTCKGYLLEAETEPALEEPTWPVTSTNCTPCPESTRIALDLAEADEAFLAEREVVTDAAGLARIDGLTANVDVALWVEAAGYGPTALSAVSPWPLPTGAEGEPEEEPLVVELSPARALRFRFIDAESQPVKASRVALVQSEPFQRFAVAAEGGAWVARGLSTGLDDLVVLAEADGFLPAVSSISMPDDEGAVVDVLLEHPRALSGVVRIDGKPVEGARVVFVPFGSGTGHEQLTDASGSYRFAGLASGRFQLSGWRGVHHVLVEEDIGDDDAVLDLDLSVPAEVEGIVIDRDANAPWAEAQVSLSGVGGTDSWLDTATDADGHFHFKAPPGQYELAVAQSLPSETNVQVDLVAGERRTVRLEVSRGLSLEVLVLTPDGKPCDNARVEARRPDGQGRSDLEFTDEAGLVRLNALPPGPIELRAASAHFKAVVVSVSLPSPRVTVRLEEGATLDVSVVDGSGPVLDISVYAVDEGLPGRGRSYSSGQTDERGVAHLGGLEAGEYTLAAEDDVHVPAGPPVKVRVSARGHHRVTVRLESGHAVEGIAVDEAGAPVAEAWINVVSLQQQGGTSRSGTSDAQGRFTIEHVPAGRFNASASHGTAGTAVDVEGEVGKPLRLVFRRSARITGRVVDQNGAPVRRFQVNYSAILSAQGRFVLRDLAPGPLNLVLSGPFVSRTIDLELASGEVRDLGEVVVDSGGTVEGVVVDLAGSPVHGASVEVRISEEELHDGPAVLTGPDGRFHVEHLGTGPAQLRALYRGAMSSPVTARPGELATLRLEQARAFEVRLRGPDGQPASGRIDVIELPSEPFQEGPTPGTYRSSSVPPGPFQLWATSADSAVSVRVAVDGSQGSVDVALTPEPPVLREPLRPEPAVEPDAAP